MIRMYDQFPLADGADNSLTLILDAPVPDFKDVPHAQLLERARAYYAKHAERFVDALLDHAPGGFVDAVLGELLYRKSCIFRVTGGYPEKAGR